MRAGSFLGLQLLAAATALWIASCASPLLTRTHAIPEHGIDSTIFEVSTVRGDKHVPSHIFHAYQSGTGWSFSATAPSWLEVPNVSTDIGIPTKTLVKITDRKVRITFYETSGSHDFLKPDSLSPALAYLFKADPVTAREALPSLPKGMVFFKPAQDTIRHWGILVRSDTSILFIHIESKNQLEPSQIGILPDIDMSPRPQRSSDATELSRRSFKASLENTWGLKALEDTNWQSALKHFQTALSLDTSNAAYLINCAAIFQLRKDNLGGIDYLSNYPALLAQSSQLAGTMGAMNEELSRYQEAKSWAIHALELDPTNTEWLINLSDALWGLGERVHSKNVLLRRYEEKPDFRLSIYLASTLLGLEEYENARLVLVQAHLNTPPSPNSVEYYLRALAGLKEYETALEYQRSLGEKFPPTSNNYLFKGICEFNLKLYQLAAASAQAALSLDPANRDAQQLSTQISALMGNRSNLILRTPLSPLKTKGSLTAAKALLNVADNQKLAGQFPLTLLSQNIVYSWVPKGRWKKTRHQIYYIHDARKLIRLSELTYEINPNYSRFYVNQFRLYNANLKLMDEEHFGDFYVTKSHNSTLHPENLLVHLPIKTRPGIQYLEIMTTEESQLPVAEFPYLRYDHAYPFPILECRFEILHPPKHLIVSAFGEAKIDSLADRIAIRMNEPLAGFEDNFRPANDEFGTGFSAAPFTTWPEVGKSYQQMLKKAGIRFDSLPVPVRERALEIMEHNRNGNPVQALFRFVRDSVRYNNFEFSLQALVPDKSETVLTNGYSDCKGHALLLMQMLNAQSLEAHLCLVSLNHVGDLDQPSLHQFNHMIVQVPAQKGMPEYFLDPTDKQYAFRRTPLALEGKNVLVLNAENSHIATIPELDSSGEHRVQVFHHVKVETAQSALGEDSLVMTGKVAGEFRTHMRTWNKATKYENLLSWLAQSYPSFADERFRVMNEDDADAPLVMVFKYRRKFQMHASPQEFEHFPMLELSFLRFPKADNRRAPVYFPHEIQIQSQWQYELPNEYTWKPLSLDRELSEHYLHWMLSVNERDSHSMTITQKWRIEPFVAAPEEYFKIQTEWEPILSSSGLKLTVLKQFPSEGEKQP